MVDDFEVEGSDGEFCRALAAVPGAVVPERDSQPGIEFAHAEWLGHVVIGALVQCVDLAVLGAVRRQYDDRHGAPGSDPLADLQAVHVRQAQVQHDNGV